MAKILPESNSSLFLLCEDMRQEIGNKLSFMGVFTNNDIVIPAGTLQIVLPSLVCVLLARWGNGPITTRMIAAHQDGSVLFETPLENAVLETGKSHLMVMKLMVPTLKFGVYTAKYLFDDLVIERTFEIKEGLTSNQ
jgi:hypothetical protein